MSHPTTIHISSSSITGNNSNKNNSNSNKNNSNNNRSSRGNKNGAFASNPQHQHSAFHRFNRKEESAAAGGAATLQQQQQQQQQTSSDFYFGDDSLSSSDSFAQEEKDMRARGIQRSHLYIYDRVNRQSKYGADHPPTMLCAPPPCVSCCPLVLEQNPCCEALGQVGVVHHNNLKTRLWLMRLGLVSNVLGLLLTVVACGAMSQHYELLRHVSMSTGSITVLNQNRRLTKLRVFVGLRSIAWERSTGGGGVVVDGSEICNLRVREGVPLLNEDLCRDCENANNSFWTCLVGALVSYWLSIFTNVLRMYPNYDVNCQKGVGIIVSIVAMSLNLLTWRGYYDFCFAAFFNGQYLFDNGQIIREPRETEDSVFVMFSWAPGFALLAVILATFLKVVDFISHFMLPTPSITRNRQEQRAYDELLREANI